MAEESSKCEFKEQGGRHANLKFFNIKVGDSNRNRFGTDSVAVDAMKDHTFLRMHIFEAEEGRSEDVRVNIEASAHLIDYEMQVYEDATRFIEGLFPGFKFKSYDSKYGMPLKLDAVAKKAVLNGDLASMPKVHVVEGAVFKDCTAAFWGEKMAERRRCAASISYGPLWVNVNTKEWGFHFHLQELWLKDRVAAPAAAGAGAAAAAAAANDVEAPVLGRIKRVRKE